MKYLYLFVLMFMLVGCSSSVESFHLLKAVEVCEGLENIHSISSTPSQYVYCRDGKFINIEPK